MLTLDAVKALAKPSAASPADTDATLSLPPNPHVGGLIDVLTQYFGEDDAHTSVKVVVGGEEFGYIHREDVYALANSSQKGLGASDYAALPGMTSYRLLRLRCPVPGCPQRLSVTAFDEEDPPTCSIHPGRSMEIDS
jgi:hypothetical protein